MKPEAIVCTCSFISIGGANSLINAFTKLEVYK